MADCAMVGVEYLHVVFPEQRVVLANDNEVGFTNHTLILPANEYAITLSGGGYAPVSMDVVLNGTSVVRPKVVVFELAAVVTTRGIHAAKMAAAPKRRRANAGQPKPARRSAARGKPKTRRRTASTETRGKRRGG
jgi:hypothetical protein